MAQETDAQLQTRRGVIENETAAGANTAVRVGDMFENIIDSKINNDKIIDEDNMASDSATKVPTQQSVKAYVLANVGGGSVTSVSGTSNRITSTGGATPIIDISSVYDTAITSAIDAKVVDSIADSDTTHAPSRNAVFDALALKADLASEELELSLIASLQYLTR